MTSIRTSARTRLRDAIVLASFVPPVSLLLRLIYRIATWWAVKRLRTLPFVRSVLLTGSVAMDDCVYGASDLDFIVLVEGRQDRLFVNRMLRASFRRWRRLFPFIGPVEERAHNVFFLDELDRDRHAAILKCRIKTGLSRSLHGEPAPDLPALLMPDEVLAEIALQLKSVANKLLESDLNLYFWKAKLRVLLALWGRDKTWRDAAVLLDPPSATLLRTLFTSSNRRLFFHRDDHANQLAWNLVSRLCQHIVEIHGLARLPTVPIAFRSTPAPQCGLQNIPSLPDSIVPHAMAHDAGAFGGPLILSTAGDVSLLLELRRRTLRDLMRGLHVGRTYNRANDGETLLWCGDYVFQVAGKVCVGVLSRWDSPHLFPDNFTEAGLLNYPEPFFKLLLLERDGDLEYLKGFYWRPIEPDTAPDHPSHHHDDSLRYFEHRNRILNGFASIHLLLSLSGDELVNFGSVDQVFDDAAVAFPEHTETLQRLSRYSHALAKNTLHQDADKLPPGLLRAGIHLFGDRLYGREIRSDYAVSRRLTLSLCVCTRNRADELHGLLQSTATQCRLPDEIVIIDNGSNDHTRDVVQAFATRPGAVPLRYIVDRSPTIGALRNRAVSESAGEIICFTDDDCILHQGWFRNIEESFLLEDRIGAVGGLMCHYVENPDSLVDVFHQEYLGIRI
jgi:Glycosyl transferase family 2